MHFLILLVVQAVMPGAIAEDDPFFRYAYEKFNDLETKIVQLEKASETKISGLKSEMTQMEEASEIKIRGLKSEIAQMKEASETKISGLKSEMTQTEEASETKISGLESEITQMKATSETKIKELESKIAQMEKAGQQCPQGRKGAECRKNNNPDDSDDDDDDGNDCSGLIYSFHGPLITRDGAKADCENRGLKLAEPKTTHQVKCLMSTLPSNKNYWIGGECVGCSEVTEDKWQWSNGGKIALNNPSWKKGLPSDTGIHDAFFLTIKKAVGFVNHEPLHKYNYVCE